MANDGQRHNVLYLDARSSHTARCSKAKEFLPRVYHGAITILMESLILAQDERWRRA